MFIPGPQTEISGAISNCATDSDIDQGWLSSLCLNIFTGHKTMDSKLISRQDSYQERDKQLLVRLMSELDPTKTITDRSTAAIREKNAE